MQEFIKQSVKTTQADFHQLSADCFLLFEKYRLKTNVIGINLEKDMVLDCYYELEGRMIDRYQILYEQLQSGLAGLEKNFKIAQATHLRTLNNIMRNYRKRVGTLGNQPLQTFKYNRFDKYERILLESIIHNDKDAYQDLQKMKEELNIALNQGKVELNDKYKRNPTIKEDFKFVLEVIDKTQCYAYKYYDNFERSMQNTISTMESCFDKLNGYLTIWENVGSIKAYEVKSLKEIEIEDRKTANALNKRVEEFDEEELEELYDNCPQYSLQKDEYKTRLVELRHSNKEKQRKMETVGKMFNKRKNRAGILMNRKRDATVLDWYFNIENEKANFTFNDEYKSFSLDNIQNDYKPTEYQVQKSFKKERIDEIKLHLQKYQASSGLNFEWWYDKFGKDGTFDLILCGSQQIQKRVEFQVNKQTVFQTSDDRRKRQILDKHKAHIRDSSIRQSLHIGYMFTYEREELEWLQERKYNTDYYPDLMADQVSSSSVQFSEDEASQEIIEQPSQEPQVEEKKKKVGKVKFKKGGKELTKPVIDEPEEQVKQQDIEIQQEQEKEEFDFSEGGIQQKLIQSYFKQYSRKVLRRQAEPQYKKSSFVYSESTSFIDWSSIRRAFSCEKIFIYTKGAILYFRRIFSSTTKQKMKCTVYSMMEDIDEDFLKGQVTSCFEDLAIVTVKFIDIYTELEGQNKIYFNIGLMLMLVKKGEMPEDYQNEDYVHEGKIVIEDFNCYFNPEANLSAKSLFRKRYNQKNQDQDKMMKEEIVTNFTRDTFEKSPLKGKKNQDEIHDKKDEKQKQENIKEEQIREQQGSQILQKKSEEENNLKRSNSRQHLIAYESQLIQAQNDTNEKQDSAEEDYQCL